MTKYLIRNQGLPTDLRILMAKKTEIGSHKKDTRILYKKVVYKDVGQQRPKIQFHKFWEPSVQKCAVYTVEEKILTRSFGKQANSEKLRDDWLIFPFSTNFGPNYKETDTTSKLTKSVKKFLAPKCPKIK